MPSYVITGVSKGLGWEFMVQLSSDPKNTIVGIIRNKPPTVARVAEELSDRKNITLLEADLTSYDALKKAAEDAGAVLGGKLDILIANAGSVPQFDALYGVKTLSSTPEQLTSEFRSVIDVNVLGNIHLYNLFLPLILNGQTKKVICISSGMGDPDFSTDWELYTAPLYSASKAAMNMITSKFHAQYKRDGVLFMSICPGMVEVGHFSCPTPEQMVGLEYMVEKFRIYSPGFKGPDTPTESVKAVMKVINDSTVEKDGGAFISHFGNRKWV